MFYNIYLVATKTNSISSNPLIIKELPLKERGKIRYIIKGFLKAYSIVQFFCIKLATNAGVLGVRVLSGFLLKVLCVLIQLYIKIITASRALK